jgi:nitroreductase
MKKMMDDSNGKFDSTVRTLLLTLTANSTVVLIPHEETFNENHLNTTKDKTDRQMVRDYYNVAIKELGIDKSRMILCDSGSIEVEVVELTIKDLDLLVVMRYHTMIVATREGKVSAAYSWAPKYQAVLDGAGIGDSGILSFDDNEEAVRKIWTLYDRRSELEPKIKAFARANGARIDKMFEEVADAAETFKLASNSKSAETFKLTTHFRPAGFACSNLADGVTAISSSDPFPLLVSRNRCPANLAAVPTFHRNFSRVETRSREETTGRREVKIGALHEIKEYDTKRFERHLAMESLPAEELSHDNLMALVLKYQHQLEKGLAMPNRRTQFGVQSKVFRKLVKYSTEYLSRYGPNFIFDGLGAVVDQYIGFHKSRGEKVDAIVTELKEHLKSNNVEWQEYDGGIVTVNKTTMMKMSSGGFADLVLARRSIRQYAPRLENNSTDFEDFRKEVYDSIRLAAEGTPSVCNRQGVKVVAVRDVEKIEQAIAIQGGGRGHDNPEYLIMIVTNLQIFREERERNQAYVDGGLFAMSLMYAFQSKGLATCSLNFAASMQNDIKMRELLDVDDSHVIVMFMAVGRYREDVVLTVSPRRAADDIQSIVREI